MTRSPTVKGSTAQWKSKRGGTQPSGKGPEDYFTGTVRVDPLHVPPDPARVSMALVTVKAARPREIRPGDVVWFPPGEKHWHGATPTTAMSHIAVQEKLAGENVEWDGEGH